MRGNQRAGRGVVGGAFDPARVERLEVRRALAVDLMLEAQESFEPLSTYVPGDVVEVPFAVRNNGASAFTGRFRVTVTALRDNGFAQYEPEGPSRVVSGTLTGVKPDESRLFTATIPVTGEYRPGDYVFEAELVPLTTGGVEIEDEYWGDNFVSTEENGPVEFSWRFGSFEGREGVPIELIDKDGTRFSIALGGFGYGEVELVNDNLADPEFDVLVTATSPIPVTVTFAVEGKARPSANKFIDFRGDIGFESDSDDYDALVRDFSGPRLNLTGSATLPSRNPEITDSIRAILSTSAELQELWNSLVPLGGGNARFRNVTGELTFDGGLGSLSARDLVNASVLIDGSCGSIVVREVRGSVLEVHDDAETFTAQAVQDSELWFNLRLSELAVGRLTRSSVDVNSDGLPMRTRIDVDIDRAANSEVFIDMKVRNLHVGRWIDSTTAARGSLTARSIGTVTTDAPTAGDPSAGRWDADVFVIGGLNLAKQLGSVVIGGTLRGTFFVGGSVGSFDVAALQTGTWRSQVEDRGFFAPSLAASGTVNRFTATDLRNGAIWASHVKNVRVTVTTNSAWFELAGGMRLNRQALVDADPQEAVESVAWASGVVGSYKATLASGVTGFISRAVSGVDVSSPESTVARSSVRRGALDLGAGYAVVGAMTTSRIAAIEFTGSMTGNSAQFSFLQYPSASFRFGAVQVLVPTGPASGQVVDLFPGGGPRASTFFRAARP